jgi:hypothetical protein
MSSDAIETRLHELRELAKQYAKAEAQRTYLEEFKRSKLAMLMKQSEVEGHATVAAQEREARAHHDYIGLLEGLRAATEEAERSRWHLKIAEMGAELWRTQQASLRAERKGYGA